MKSSEHSPHIEVEVSTTYLANQSEPELEEYVFLYTIIVRNRGDIAARLMRRHWLITDAEGKTQEVEGEGVVGEQPYLQPGEQYEYSSGAVLPTPIGHMQGSYQMVSDTGETFQAAIKPFCLAVPTMLH